ncbi:uncharacterized protein [Taeniopygia guttata]|uniref:uncharacterized protein n=1 Tax=Taeniopygia guttata TaxID=59729 RepID=UPI003BB93CA8
MAGAQEPPAALSDIQVRAGRSGGPGAVRVSAAVPFRQILPEGAAPGHRAPAQGGTATGKEGQGFRCGSSPAPAPLLPALPTRDPLRFLGAVGSRSQRGRGRDAASRRSPAPVRGTQQEIPAGKLGGKEQGSPATCSHRRGAAEPARPLRSPGSAFARPGVAEGHGPAVPRVPHPPPVGFGPAPLPPCLPQVLVLTGVTLPAALLSLLGSGSVLAVTSWQGRCCHIQVSATGLWQCHCCHIQVSASGSWQCCHIQVSVTGLWQCHCCHIQVSATGSWQCCHVQVSATGSWQCCHIQVSATGLRQCHCCHIQVSATGLWQCHIRVSATGLWQCHIRVSATGLWQCHIQGGGGSSRTPRPPGAAGGCCQRI